MEKSKGQIDYEADVKWEPTYHDGTPRKQWSELNDIQQWSWEKTPWGIDLIHQ